MSAAAAHVCSAESWYAEPRRPFLLIWALFGLVLFSASANKLPGYVLPLLPAIAALAAPGSGRIGGRSNVAGRVRGAAYRLPDRARRFFPPRSRTSGRPRRMPAFDWTWLTPAIPLAAVWISGRARPALSRRPGRDRRNRDWFDLPENPVRAGDGTDRHGARAGPAGGCSSGRRVPRRDQARSGVRARVLPRYSVASM